jgi:hypothetical protein
MKVVHTGKQSSASESVRNIEGGSWERSRCDNRDSRLHRVRIDQRQVLNRTRQNRRRPRFKRRMLLIM